MHPHIPWHPHPTPRLPGHHLHVTLSLCTTKLLAGAKIAVKPRRASRLRSSISPLDSLLTQNTSPGLEIAVKSREARDPPATVCELFPWTLARSHSDVSLPTRACTSDVRYVCRHFGIYICMYVFVSPGQTRHHCFKVVEMVDLWTLAQRL